VENFALLPISKSYQAIIGKDCLRAMGIKIDFGPNADNVVTIQTPPRVDTGCDIASMLPEWENDVDIVGSVFQLGAIQVESPELGHEFQVLSHKKFMKLRKRASREEAKIIANNAKNKQKNNHAITTSRPLSVVKIS
jgi:hypothetical protein